MQLTTGENEFLSKDGQYYTSYIEMVAANKRHNEDILRQKGLLNFADQIRSQIKKKKTLAAKVVLVEEPIREPRRSKRLRKAAPEHDGIDNLDSKDLFRDAKRRYVVHDDLKEQKPKMIRRVKIIKKKVELSKRQQSKLQKLVDWTEDMYEFLLTVPHGNSGKVVSEDNARNVMKQVERLVTGAGITYHHWPNGTYFLKGTCVDLSDDFDEMYQDAVAYEKRYGRDLGNGWLLRHPIRKMQCFQQYRLECMQG